MAKKVKKQSRIKTKKKTWFKILGPSIFGKKEVGETYLTSAELAVGKIMKVNMKDLTGSMRDQNVHITLKIDSLKGQILQTKAVGYELVSSYVKRAVRKRYSRIDNVFRFNDKNGNEVILKSMIVALNRNKRSTGVALQNKLKELLQGEISKFAFEDSISKLATKRIQIILKKQLTVIYPVRDVLIRSFKLANATKQDNTVKVVDESEQVENTDPLEVNNEENQSENTVEQVVEEASEKEVESSDIEEVSSEEAEVTEPTEEKTIVKEDSSEVDNTVQEA